MNRIACVLVSSPRALEFLGPYTVLDWTLAALAAVRGLDRVLCYATKPHQKRVAAHLKSRPEILLRASIDGLSCCDTTARWLRTDFPVDGTMIVVRPVQPLLSGARIEACVEAVETGNHTECRPVRPVTAASCDPNYREYPAVIPLRGVYVRVLGREGLRLRTVEATPIEALDYDEPDERKIIQTLVSAGVV